MYRITWFEKSNYTSNLVLKNSYPSDWIMMNDINKVLISAWEEHCLECAPPECYGICSRYSERADKKCRKTIYGIKRRKDLEEDYLSPVQFKFAPWGKIETYKSNKYQSYCTAIKTIKHWYWLDSISRAISNSFRFLNKTMKLCGLMEVIKNKSIYGGNYKVSDEKFLFQAYSTEEIKYNLFVEVLANGTTCYRTSIPINKGYNQRIIDFKDLISDKQKVLIRYYPENNICAELVVLFSEFVLFKEQVLDLETVPQVASKVKCVAWDLDNTIWDGILIESKPEELSLRPGVREAIEKLDGRGIINIIVSKNDEEAVIPVLERLGILDYFVYVIANWNLKSTNLKQISKVLNLNINSFAFIDDSKFERGEVADNIKNIRIYDENIVGKLCDLEEFEVVVTEDSKNRRHMYQVEKKRLDLKLDYGEDEIRFLQDCKLRLNISSISKENMERCFELIHRTNQLNLSGYKYSKQEFETLISNEQFNCCALSCSDKYGAYGQVGVIVFEIQDTTLAVKEFALSCRVADKWIEPAILTWFENRYEVKKVEFNGLNNNKNSRLFNTLEKFGMKKSLHEKDGSIKMEAKTNCLNFPEIVVIEDEYIND